METIVKYLEAIQEIDESDRELDRILAALSRTADTRLGRRVKVPALATNEPTHGPTDESPSHEPSAGASAHVLIVEEIINALSRMRRAYDAAESAWGNVEPEFRGRLSPPPKRFPDDDSL